MREIKFRGKLVHSGEWSEGNLYLSIGGTAIITPDETVTGKYGRVHPETVGQYTGLTDKNGKEIYEGDICKVTIYDHWTNKPISECNCLVVFEEFKIGVRHGTKNEVISFDGFKNTTVEIIGNIHNKETNQS